MDERVTISLDEYRELVIAKTKLGQIIEVFQNHDKYDRHPYMGAILGIKGYEEIKKAREEYEELMKEFSDGNKESV